MPATKTRIVIIGGGFGGAYAAQYLEKFAAKLNLEIILIDRRNYFIFYPLVVEAGTGSLEPRHAVVSIHHFLSKAKFRMAEVEGLDLVEKKVFYRIQELEGLRSVTYDHLVIALGSVTRMPNIPGLKENAFDMKSIADSVALRDRVIRMLEIANMADDEETRKECLHLVVIGGSYTGVEVAGEFQAFMARAAREYENVKPSDITVSLVDAGERIVAAIGPELSDYARKRLEKRRVRVMVKTTLDRMTDREVYLSGGKVLKSRTLVWCAGVAPPPLLEKFPFAKDKRGYLDAERNLLLKGYDNVWGIGDCTNNPSPDGTPYPATAQLAIQQAKVLAENLERVLTGQKPKNCDIKSQGSLAAIGCYQAVAKVFGIRISGFPAWFLWRSVYLMKMPSWSRRLRIALDWTIDLFLRPDIVQLGVHGNRNERK